LQGISALRVLVTGASGFVGQWAVKSLLDRGARVFASSHHEFSWPASVTPCKGDLLDPCHVRRLLEDARPDIILHLAWNVEHGRFWTALDNLDWASATINLARAATNAGVSRFVGVGTCFEYLWPDECDCDEIVTPIEPTTLYAVAKDSVRRLLEELREFSFAWARLFYLYGPSEHEQRLVASLAKNLAQGRPAPLSHGLAIRDILDVRDAGAALAALALSHVRGPVNIASGEGVSVASIAERLGRISGRPDLIEYGVLPDRADEPRRIVAAIRRLREEVKFEPTHSLDDGLADAYSWWCARTGARSHRNPSD
jgi:nucleoside-diphosphate-sugar epimerase